MKNTVLILIISLLFAGNLAIAQSSPSNKASINNIKPKVIDLNDAKYQGKSLNSVLKKYKGKVIYLDFWASWCGPCKKQMPYSKKLKEEFEGKEVAFVYISTDKNASKWTAMIDQLQISGEHYRASPEVRNQIVQQFNLQYIPRYVLINKEGKVADENAKRPSDPAIITDIKKLLL